MPIKVNVVLDDDVKADLDLLVDSVRAGRVGPAEVDPAVGRRAGPRPIVNLMRECRVTFYDAAYHALAIRHGGTMNTADRAYMKKAASAGHVALLKDWHAPTRLG